MEPAGLKVLMISSDRNICSPTSAVSLRMKEYGSLADELHIVLLSTKAHGLKNVELSKNVWVYPTNSTSRWRYPFDASKLGKQIVFDKKFIRGHALITTQDPFECGWAGLKIKNKWRIPLETQLHTDFFSPHFSGFLNSIRKRIAPRVLKQADNVRVVTETLRKGLINNFSLPAENISVLPIYVDRERIASSRVGFDLHERFGWRFILLSVSRLTKEKNLPMALLVLKKLTAFFPSVGLVIVGAGTEEENLKSLAQKLGIESKIAFVGWQENLAPYYRGADIFVQTSNFEGYGLSLVEAGLSGLPIVTTAVGVANDLKNGEDAIICPTDDAEYMFKGVYDLLSDNGKRESLKANIKRALEGKLISKEEYLKQLKAGWENTAGKIHL